MASPFPGMDPYLEAPFRWPGVHHRLINAAADQLQVQLLPRGYYVDIDERIWLEDPNRHIYPDVALVERPKGARGATPALLSEPDEPVHVRVLDVELREAFVQVFTRDGNRLITGIEFVSPANKIPSKGRRLYRRKQHELLHHGVNLVEIDLLRSGEHVLRVPWEAIGEAAEFDYLACVTRPGNADFELYPMRLPTRLARIRVPLKPGDADAVLDLQAIVGQAYESGAYQVRIDYSADPLPPLPPRDVAWADQLLRATGLRDK